MCEPASMIVTKNKIFWSKNTESHSEIIKEFDLSEQNIRKEITLVPVEISPPENDFRKPIAEWLFRVDHAGIPRELPAWWDAKEAEASVRAVLPEWIAAKVVLPGQKRCKITSGQIVAIYETIEYIGGSAIIKSVGGSAIIKSVGDSAIIESVWGSATIKSVGGSATIKSVGDSAIIKSVGDSAIIENLWGTAIIENLWGTAIIKSVGDSAIIKGVWDSAIIKSVGGSAIIESVGGSAIIKSVWDSATIKSVGDSATLIAYKALTPDILKSSKAVLMDRSEDTVICYVGKAKK